MGYIDQISKTYMNPSLAHLHSQNCSACIREYSIRLRSYYLHWGETNLLGIVQIFSGDKLPSRSRGGSSGNLAIGRKRGIRALLDMSSISWDNSLSKFQPWLNRLEGPGVAAISQEWPSWPPWSRKNCARWSCRRSAYPGSKKARGPLRCARVPASASTLSSSPMKRALTPGTSSSICWASSKSGLEPW